MIDPTLRIVAYSNSQYSGNILGERSLFINPEKYTHKHSPESIFSFELYFDATGVISSNVVPLQEQLSQFKEIIYNYNGEIYNPNYLILFWKMLEFKCRLTSLEISYTLFKPDGTPLRAKASVVFQEITEENLL